MFLEKKLKTILEGERYRGIGSDLHTKDAEVHVWEILRLRTCTLNADLSDARRRRRLDLST